MVRREFSPKINRILIVKYFIIAISVFGSVFVLMDNNITYHISIFKFLPEFLSYVFLGVIGYLGITFLIDKRTKKLFLSIINELMKR